MDIICRGVSNAKQDLTGQSNAAHDYTNNKYALDSVCSEKHN